MGAGSYIFVFCSLVGKIANEQNSSLGSFSVTELEMVCQKSVILLQIFDVL